MLSFNPFKSKTVWAAISGVVIYLAGVWGDGLTATEIGTAVTILLAALGVRDAIAANGTGK